MKQFRILWSFILVGLISACNFTEEIHFNEDGSGKLNIHFDGDEMMAAMASMVGDSLSNEKAMDTTLVFKDLLRDKKDSIATLSPEEQAKLKKLEPFSIRMVMNQAKGQMSFNMFSDFKRVEEVNDALNAFQDASVLGPQPGGEAPPLPMGGSEQSTEVDYMFTGNKFIRTIKIKNQALFEKGLEDIKQAEMFLSGSTYTFKYHFPRKVKSANVEGATFSLDGKTMTYNVDFLQMTKDPKSMTIEVELED